LQLNPSVNAFQRKFVNEVRRCEEMERKLRTCLSSGVAKIWCEGGGTKLHEHNLTVTLKRKKIGRKSRERGGGHVPWCPIAGDAYVFVLFVVINHVINR